MVCSAHRRLARWTASPWSRARRGWRCRDRSAAGVPLQLRGERRERVAEVLQEREHLLAREQVFHHHEAHEVQAEVTRDRGRFHRGAQPARVGGLAGRVGSYTRRCRADWPSRLAGA